MNRRGRSGEPATAAPVAETLAPGAVAETVAPAVAETIAPAVAETLAPVGVAETLAPVGIADTLAPDSGADTLAPDPVAATLAPTAPGTATDVASPRARQGRRAEDSLPPSTAADEDLPNIGRFEVQRKLGEGGMGAVYLATDPTLGRRVAIKVLRRDAGGDVEAAKKRLLREAQGTAQLSDDNVVVVYEVGTHEGQVYLAMEYVSGTTLRAWQEQRGWREILAMYLRAGRGLRAAHEAGLVHRDFKPDNVMVGNDGRLRVTDFGLVAPVDTPFSASQGSEAAISLRSELELAVSLTLTGSIMGTPRYMPPEQHLGQPADERADQFAFCVSLYEAWYHQPPFAGVSYEVMLHNVMSGTLQPAPPASEVPPALHEVLARGLRRERKDRYPSMQELLAALEEAAGPSPAVSATMPAQAPPRSRRGLIAAGLVAAAAIAVALIMYLRRGEPGPTVEEAEALRDLHKRDVEAQWLRESRAPTTAAAPTTPPPVAPPTTPAAPATVEVAIDSKPPGARVVLDGRDVGATPYHGTLPRGDYPVRLIVRLAGYTAVTRTLTPREPIGETIKLAKPRSSSSVINPF